jgi:hypothetical protein
LGPLVGEWGKAGNRERVRRENMVQKCVHMYVNAKMIPVETVPGISRREIKESNGGGEFKYEIFDTF